MSRYASIARVGILFFLTVISTVRAPGPAAAAQTVSRTFFCSGQAALDPRNQAKSQQLAIKNFMAQGLIQAMGSFLAPDQMGAQFDKIEESVLSGPAKYVNTYQLFSEKQSDGEYQVVGKVTVSMKTLEQDLAKLGVLGANNGSASAPPPAAAPPPASVSPPPAPPAASLQPALPQKSQPVPAPPVAASPSGPPGNDAKPATRGIHPTKNEVLWAVVEKWDEKWMLPTDSGDIRCIFARSISREMDGFGFSILLPQPGSVEMDNDGNIPPYQAVSIAGELGVKDVVVGKVSYVVDRQKKEVSLNADLRVIRPGQDQTGVQIRKTLSMEDLSNQAGAFELARRIAPQLSALLGGPGTVANNAEQGSSEFPAQLGKLVIHMSSLQYAHWTELAPILRRQFPDMHVDDIQIGPAETSVKLDKVDGGYLLKMNGAMLPSGVALRIDSYSTQAGDMKISFVSPVKGQAESK